ncbi:MAG TPA: hypothetical protein VK400_08175 [Pyrinomonadaceae bacterium]|nr:hypothetical protein [Pyrinomonadaceae bacterium]
MKNRRNFYTLGLIFSLLIVLSAINPARAQSNDIDNPTPLPSTTIEGEGDGKAETIYYWFTAGKGDVKVTVDAKTDDRSTPLRVALLDADGKELLPIYVVAKGAGAREVGTRRFVRDTKVILKIRMDDDKDVKLLTYKIKLEGAIKVEETPTGGQEAGSTPTTTGDSTNTSVENTTTDSTNNSGGNTNATESNTGGKKEKTTDKIKKKVKKKAKETVKEIVDN